MDQNRLVVYQLAKVFVLFTLKYITIEQEYLEIRKAEVLLIKTKMKIFSI